jgi:hypothetical protein
LDEASAVNNGVQFLVLDLDTALTFMDTAERIGIEEIRQRSYQNARHAYHTVLLLMQNLMLDDAQKETINAKLIF